MAANTVPSGFEYPIRSTRLGSLGPRSTSTTRRGRNSPVDAGMRPSYWKKRDGFESRQSRDDRIGTREVKAGGVGAGLVDPCESILGFGTPAQGDGPIGPAKDHALGPGDRERIDSVIVELRVEVSQDFGRQSEDHRLDLPAGHSGSPSWAPARRP